MDQGYRFVMFDGLNRFYAADGEDELAASLAAPVNVLDDFVRHQDVQEVQRAQEHALSLEAAIAAERLEVGEDLSRLRVELAESQAHVLLVESAADEARVHYATELHALARRCRATSDRAEHTDELVANLRDDLTAAQVPPCSPWARRRGCRRTSTPSRPPTSSVPPGAFVRCTAGRGGRPDWISEERAALHGLPRMTAAWHRPGEHLRRR